MNCLKLDAEVYLEITQPTTWEFMENSQGAYKIDGEDSQCKLPCTKVK